MVHRYALGTLAGLALALAIAAPLHADEAIDPATAKPDDKGEVLFYDVRPLGLEGQGWAEVQSPFDRLPAKAEGVVRPAVWSLGRHSAGLCVRFVSDAAAVYARWTVTGDNLAMTHMPATGVSGVDLYVRTDEGRWRWLAVGFPSAKTTTAKLVGG